MKRADWYSPSFNLRSESGEPGRSICAEGQSSGALNLSTSIPTGSAAPRQSARHSKRCSPLPTAGSSTRFWYGRQTD